METLAVNEIFFTIQGESSRAGLPCAMVRLGGCNLRCSWCDTQYACEESAPRMTVEAVLAAVAQFPTKRVEVTGGEPMLQDATALLLADFLAAGYEVLLETNGSVDLASVPGGVRTIMDVKCPASGEAGTTHWDNLAHMTATDEVKFVLADEDDYDYARKIIDQYDLLGRCGLIVSPCAGLLDSDTLAAWILRDGLDVRLGLQLHKFIWPAEARGV